MRVNGESVSVTGSVRELLAFLAIDARGVAVARNGEIVPRSLWDSTALTEHDEIEIVTAAAGG